LIGIELLVSTKKTNNLMQFTDKLYLLLLTLVMIGSDCIGRCKSNAR